tara:strand:- start:1766 stop:2641 length:876 start_codon:yes stop_codon:yes gene_type:complete
MKNLCTVSDSNFLPKGMALYDSLKEKSSDFVLHYLLIDNDKYDLCKNNECESLKFYKVSDLIESDPFLKSIKEGEYRYFCWILSAYFSNKLLNENNFRSITYVDSDIYFYETIDVLFDQFSDKDIGVFRHRQFPMNTYRPEGLLNLGIIHFKNTPIGREALNWWNDAVLHKKYPGLATCGDQKYIEFFMVAYPQNIQVDGEVGHSAPWEWQLYDLSDFNQDRTINWEGRKQKLIFNHFSQFHADFNNDTYIASTSHHIYTPLSAYTENEVLKKIHEEYFLRLKNSIEKYNL